MYTLQVKVISLFWTFWLLISFPNMQENPKSTLPRLPHHDPRYEYQTGTAYNSLENVDMKGAPWKDVNMEEAPWKDLDLTGTPWPWKNVEGSPVDPRSTLPRLPHPDPDPNMNEYQPGIVFNSLENVDMKGAPWKDVEGNPVDFNQIIKEENSRGILLDVYIAQAINPTELCIQPFGVQGQLINVESEANSYIGLTTFPNQRIRRSVLALTIFCCMPVKKIGSYVRVRMVENPLLPGNDVQVLLLDYGIYVPAGKDKLGQLSLSACDFPAIGANGCLSEANSQGAAAARTFGEKEVQHFCQNVRHKRFMFKVTSAFYDKNDSLRLEGELFCHPQTKGLVVSRETIEKELSSPLELDYLTQNHGHTLPNASPTSG